MNFFILLLTIAGSALTEKVSYQNYKVYKVAPKNDEALHALRNLDESVTDFSRFQFWESPSKVGRNATLMVAPEMQEAMEDMFEDLGIQSQVMIGNVQEAINRESPRNVRNVARLPVDWTDYNTLDEINEWLESLAVEFPDYITVLKPGKSHLGRDIVGVKLDLTPDVPKEVVFMESNIHAREWVTSAVNNYILNQFLRNDTHQWLAANYTWYFFPVMNPDGFAYSHEVNRMWRKTRTRYNVFCYGADPNRNWAYQWMNGGASQNPCSDIYAGPRPFSEPSVDVMKDFIASVAENMVAYIDFHSFSQMLLLPFGHTTDHLMNYDAMMEIATIALEELRLVHGTEYTYGNIAETIYIASGSSMDWVKGEFEVPIAYTYELRDRGEFGFILPADQIIPTAEETLVSLLAIFREYRSRYPQGLKLKVLQRLMGQCTSNKSKGSLSVKKILSHHKKPKKMDRHKHLKESKNEDYRVYPMEERMDSNRQKPQKCTKGVAMSFGFKKKPAGAWEPGISDSSDPNGNRDVPNSAPKPRVATPKPSRSRLVQVPPKKPMDSPFPLHFSQRRGRGMSPSPEEGFSRNITIVTRTEVAEISEVVKNEDRSHGAVMRTSGGLKVQPGKFTFQSTRLPQPEPIRVMETKTAKTIANNNKKSARIWRQYEENCSIKSGMHENARREFEAPRENLQQNEESLDISQSLTLSEAYTPPPLPELPSVFNIEKHDNPQKENQQNSAKKFLEFTPFVSTSRRHLLDRTSPQSSSDQEWINGGEAMADEVSLALSPKRKVQNPETQNIGKPDATLDMIDSLKDSMHLTLSEEDPKFAAVAISNNAAALLDDEILSPVESLLSSESSESPAKPLKEVSPSPPGSPSVATYSLSLSEDKEDFLIDDEIADQPELVFEEQQYIPELIDKDLLSTMDHRRRASFSSDFSPLPVRQGREFLQSANQRGSFQSLSPCESICSEDLMMDYEASLINEVDNWDKQSGPCFSVEGTPRSKRRNNNAFRSPGNSLKNTSSPDCGRSPKRGSFNSFGSLGVTYDPTSESLTLTRANHSAIQHDIIGLKTMLLTLRRVLSESEVQMPLTSSMENLPMACQNNNNEFRMELADLRRQVIFLQGQLDDKEKTVADLQRQIDDLAIGSSLEEPPLLELDKTISCNAATQTERTRPTSSGIFSLTPSPMDDNNPILRFLVQ